MKGYVILVGFCSRCRITTATNVLCGKGTHASTAAPESLSDVAAVPVRHQSACKVGQFAEGSREDILQVLSSLDSAEYLSRWYKVGFLSYIYVRNALL